jgi:hypothetical protein
MAKRKAKGGPPPKVSGPFDNWKNKTVRVPYTWDSGDENLKGDPFPGTFTLKAKKVPDGSGGSALRFILDFVDDKLPDYWHQVVLQPMGSKAPPKIDPRLPANLSTAEVRRRLQFIIDDELNVEGTKIRRLEGFIPVKDGSGNPALDEVRMVYLPKALENAEKPSKPRDFVLISFRSPGDDPNGAGSGPPDG